MRRRLRRHPRSPDRRPHHPRRAERPRPGGRPSAGATPGLATAALVCGIVGLVLFFLFVPSVVALVLGLVAASRAKHAGGPHTGLGRARAGWIMGAVGVSGFAALIVGAALTDGFETDDVSVHRLDVGDCVDLEGVSEPSDVVDRLPRRDCDEPHDAEVYLIDDVAVEGDEYPVKPSTAEIEERCTGQAFEEYTGGTFADSSLDYFFLYPTEESWEAGDRSFTCMAVSVDGSPIDHPVRGSGE